MVCAAAGRLRDLFDTVHDVSTAASRRLLDLAKAQVAARAGLPDSFGTGAPYAAESATMAEVCVCSPAILSKNIYASVKHHSPLHRSWTHGFLSRCIAVPSLFVHDDMPIQMKNSVMHMC